MSLVVAGSLLGFMSVFAAFGMFDSGDTRTDDDDSVDDPDDGTGEEPDIAHGTTGDDTLSASEGTIEGWGGDDEITLDGTATGHGDGGDDRLVIDADDSSPNQAHGDAGNDTLIGRIDGTDTLYGGDGDDLLRGGNTHGGAGDDSLTGQTNVHGDAGDDTLNGFDQLFGGVGDDVLNLSSSATGMVGTASGGEGDDTIIAADNSNDTLFAGNDFDSAGPISGDDGDDLISFADQSNVFGGSGDDILISRSAFFNDPDVVGQITLGDGADLLAFAPSDQILPIHEPVSAYQPDIVTDFDPLTDQLAIICPEDDLAQLEVTITTDPDGAYTDVVITVPVPSPEPGSTASAGTTLQSFRLEGVTDLDPADILMFADAAAVQAGTSYGTLAPAA